MRVFVYGTLMRGEQHHAQIQDQRFVGEARTLPRYELIDLGSFPALVEGGATAVAGELYEVSFQVLAELDRLEGHPALYRRWLVALDDGMEAEAYFMPREHASGLAIVSGDWRSRCRR